MPSWVGLSISLLLELIGFLAVIGTGFFFFKRFMWKDHARRNYSMHLLILLSILITGFLAEGLRIAIEMDATKGLQPIFSPLGFSLSYIVPASPVLLKVAIRAHFFLTLSFIAYLPFSIMRHVVGSSLSTFYQKLRPEGYIDPISLKGDYFGTGKIRDFHWKELLDTDSCMHCGRCDDSCPAYIAGKHLSPQGLIRGIGQKMQETYLQNQSNRNELVPIFCDDGTIANEDIWSCTTCMGCVRTCPVYVRHLSDVVDLRRYAVLTQSQFPSEYKQVFKNLEIFGDAFGAGKLMREAWVSGTQAVKVYENSDIEILFWVGCTSALYDEKTRDLAVATAKLLDKAAIRYGILGKDEMCCGDPARRMGNEYVFKNLATHNIEIMRKYGVGVVVTCCPHCFNILKNEYPQFGADFEVLHTTQLINRLLADGRLKVKRKAQGQFTYHDPCYLGRYNGIYQDARDILERVLGSGLKEMALSGDKTFCCGAGGGNFWRGKTSGKRIEEQRIGQVVDIDATGVITACPFCKVMLDSAVREKELESPVQVTDLNALVDEIT